MEDYRREGNVLWVCSDLDPVLDVRFDIETHSLLDAARNEGMSDVVLDLSALSSVTSQYLGGIAALASEAKGLGIRLRVRASGKLAELLASFGIGLVADLEVW